jgi:hypothetical protein
LDAKKRKAEEKESKRQKKVRDKLWRNERDTKYIEGVAARKLERARKKQVKELEKACQPIPPKLLVSIPDPEAIWKAEQEEM